MNLDDEKLMDEIVVARGTSKIRIHSNLRSKWTRLEL
jgi:hypothetical protein